MAPTDTKNAVVVNDDITQLAFVSGVLRKNGFEVEACPSVSTAMKTLRKNGPPTLVITDVEMPVIDGWELCRILRSPEYREFNTVPIVVISAVFSGQRPRRICAALGANAFLPAPLSAGELAEKVNAVLSGDEALLSRVHALIAAGSSGQAQSLAGALPSTEYIMDFVGSADDAARAIATSHPELVIVEHRVGHELIDTVLRATESLEARPVVVAALAEFDQSRAAALMKQGVSACVAVPVDPEYLRIVCERAREVRAVADLERMLNRRTWQALEREQWYQSIMAATDDPVFVVSPEYRITYMNRAMGEHIGGDSLGHHCYEQLFERSSKCPWCPVETVQQGRTIHLEPGEESLGRRYDVAYSPVTRPDGNVDVMGILRDVTETKNMMVRSAQAQKMEAIGQLAGGVAHDFNNMLGVILGYADMISMTNADDDERPVDPVLEERVGTVVSAAKRASGLVDQLLAFSRQGKYQDIAVDLHQSIAEVVGLLTHTIDKRIRLEQRLETGSGIVRGDPSQLQNVLLNLALNARDAMPEGGVLRFKTAVRVVDANVASAGPWATEPGTYLALAVSDTGVGMSEEVRRRVFEPYFTTKQPGKGSGLGLAGVYGIVKNHGGFVEVESETGQGTTFHVHLPLARNGEKQADTGPDHDPVRGRGHILVVDDEHEITEAACAMLEKQGYGVTAIADSREAVQHFRENHASIDLVLLDMIMPGYDGRECFEKMVEVDPHVRVVLSTGYAVGEKVELALRRGIKGFIQKPFSTRQLCRVVYEALHDGVASVER